LDIPYMKKQAIKHINEQGETKEMKTKTTGKVYLKGVENGCTV